jgi:hypothetical protein
LGEQACQRQRPVAIDSLYESISVLRVKGNEMQGFLQLFLDTIFSAANVKIKPADWRIRYSK